MAIVRAAAPNLVKPPCLKSSQPAPQVACLNKAIDFALQTSVPPVPLSAQAPLTTEIPDILAILSGHGTRSLSGRGFICFLSEWKGDGPLQVTNSKQVLLLEVARSYSQP